VTVGSTDWPFRRLVGVIDLAGGKAVHAIAGERSSYQPVQSCGGDPVTLVRQYRELGIRSFYIADLDAIRGQPLQTTLLDEMAAEMEGDILVDLGWSGAESKPVVQAVTALVEAHPCLGIIAATETADSPTALDRLAECIAVTRICLGLDFRQGQLVVSKNLKDRGRDRNAQTAVAFDDTAVAFDAAAVDRGNDIPEWNVEFCTNSTHWVDHAITLGIHRMVILDIATVGKQVGTVTGDMCRRIKQANPNFSIWSGGGIRHASDANQLIQQGCERCLVATALQGLL